MPITHKAPKRTVRCRYCHAKGHNKSTCPHYALRIEELREGHGDDHYAVAEYDAKKAKRRSSGKSRKCSYCGEGGHNRKTCVILKSDMQQVKQKNAEYRKEIYKHIVYHGISTGAIITSDNNTRLKHGADIKSDRYRLPMIITRVNWENINIWEVEFRYFSSTLGERSPFNVKSIDALSSRYSSTMGFPLDYDLLWNKMPIDIFAMYNGDNENDWYARYKNTYFCTVVSPVPIENPPLGWLTCDDTETEKALKEFFKSRKKWDRYRSYTKGLTRDEEYELAKKEMEEGSL
jgi:hypothetical protein